MTSKSHKNFLTTTFKIHKVQPEFIHLEIES
jgi:hypothetical protein